MSMSSYWDALVARTDEKYTAEDFESAAYRLVTEQVLYHSDNHSRSAYWLVERYAKDFERVLEPLGIEIGVNSLLRYVYAKPQHEKNGAVSVIQTLLALVLRTIYDEQARSGGLTDNGEVLCDLIELDEKFRLATGREFPSKMEFDALLRQFKKWGIAKVADENSIEEIEVDSDVESPIYILIRPAIVDVLGETVLQRLGQWAQTKAAKEIDINESESSEEGV